MVCPCKGCVLVPLCRHRDYLDLFDACSLIRKYVPNSKDRHLRNNLRIDKIQELLEPSSWDYYGDGWVSRRIGNELKKFQVV